MPKHQRHLTLCDQFFIGLLFQLMAQGGVSGWNGRRPVREEFEIHAGTSYDDGSFSFGLYLFHC